MLIEGFCKKSSCVEWAVNDLTTSLHPQCPTCKEYNTWIITDECNDVPDGYDEFESDGE